MSLIGFLTAAAHDNVTGLQTFISSGIDIDARDKELRSSLHHAAANGAEDAVRHLLRLGADSALRDSSGRTPFMAAVMAVPSASARHIAAALLPVTLSAQRERGARPDTELLCDLLGRLSGQAQLDDGIVHGARLLISAGANVDQRDNYGRTPLMLLLCREQPSAGRVGTSVGHGDSDDTRGPSETLVLPPHMLTLAQELIDRGADVTAVDKEGVSVLRHAMLACNEPLVRVLLMEYRRVGVPVTRADVASVDHLTGVPSGSSSASSKGGAASMDGTAVASPRSVIREATAAALATPVFSPSTTRFLGTAFNRDGSVAYRAEEGRRMTGMSPMGMCVSSGAGAMAAPFLGHSNDDDLPLDAKGRPILSRLGTGHAGMGMGMGSGADGRYRWGGFAYCAPSGGVPGGCGPTVDQAALFDFSCGAACGDASDDATDATQGRAGAHSPGDDASPDAGGSSRRDPEASSSSLLVGLGSVGFSDRPDVSSEQEFRDLRRWFLSSEPSPLAGSSGSTTVPGGGGSNSSGATHAAHDDRVASDQSTAWRHPNGSVQDVNGSLDEDAALALALQLSASVDSQTDAAGARDLAAGGVYSSTSASPLAGATDAATEVAAAGPAQATTSHPPAPPVPSIHPLESLRQLVERERVWRRRRAMVLAYHHADQDA